MSEEEFYVKKPFKMLEYAVGLIKPFGSLFLADKDFLMFELSFLYYFICDYQIFSKLNGELRRGILNNFCKKMQLSRSKDFVSTEQFSIFFDKRIYSFFIITQKLGKETIEELCHTYAEYINILLTFSEENKAYINCTFDEAKKRFEFESKIKVNKYTKELETLLIISISPLMVHNTDLSEKF